MRGLDVHPVAVTLARVTWLLALGDLVLQRRAKLTVPVFLGDAMQWNLGRYAGGADVLVEVPGEQPLHVPAGFAEDQALFEQALDALNEGLAGDVAPEAVARRLRRIAGVAEADADALAATYARLLALKRANRNGIWIFVFRNLARPVGLSRDEQRAEVLVGNPPWIVYRHLSPGMKDRLREVLREALLGYDLWLGGKLATHQDMCALFWARGAERYLVRGGKLAFVLPYAVLNAPVFAPLRAGRMGQVRVRLTGGWALEKVWPIFGAQSGSSTTSTCVLFGRREMVGVLPAEVDRWEGRLTERDADEAEAARALVRSRVPWPRARTLVGVSPYRKKFGRGDDRAPALLHRGPGAGGAAGRETRRAADAPRMRGRAGRLDKAPWTQDGASTRAGGVGVPSATGARRNDRAVPLAGTGDGGDPIERTGGAGLRRRQRGRAPPPSGVAPRCGGEVGGAQQQRRRRPAAHDLARANQPPA